MNQAIKLQKELAEIVKTARQSENLTQHQLARKMNTKQSSLARSEQNGFSVSMAEKALKAMGMKLAFHHISYGTKHKQTICFLGGM